MAESLHPSPFGNVFMEQKFEGCIGWSLRSRATPLRLFWRGLPDETPLNWHWQPLVQWNRNQGKRYDQNYASGTKPSSPAKQEHTDSWESVPGIV